MSNAEFWDERYQHDLYHFGTEPNRFIRQVLDQIGLVENKTLIDLGCGEGRNSVYAAQMGYIVTASDISEQGLNKTRRLAEQKNTKLQTLIFDVLNDQPQVTYDTVIISFLHVPSALKPALLGKSKELLHSGGQLIAEWYHPRQRLDNYQSGGPPDPGMMFNLCELETAFMQPDWQVQHLEFKLDHLDEGHGHAGLAALSRIVVQKE